MKNANSRFVRVLAIALVVLMVVPAALVGCGSNKANNAAISEALAAAEAAKKEAEEAKAAADAAAAEAQKKAEEAIKAAEEAAQKALEEAMKNSTAAPTTTAPAPTEDLKVVSEYAAKVLADKDLDFIKTYLMYGFGITEEELEDAEDAEIKLALLMNPVNPVYAEPDRAAMAELYNTTVVAIYKANTVDYVNQLVANFVTAIEAVPTYAERIVDAYEAIDFASNYDVIDVVYANAFVANAVLTEEAVAELTKYGEDEVNVLEAIATEYYRYTGEAGAYADISAVEEVLYEAMYDDAADIVAAVVALVDPTADAGVELDVAALGYVANIDDAVDSAIKMYTAWNNTYFVKAKDTELVKYYEAFRQAFVGEAYITNFEGDYVWDALAAFEARAAELLAAAAEYKETFRSALAKIADYTSISYWKQADQVATVKADLDAWKTKYDFKDDEFGNPNANVVAIITEDTYYSYKANALVVEYFVYLEKTASAVNVADFVKAYNSDLNEDDDVVTFDFAKYGSAVASALDWYFGKVKNESREGNGGFIEIAPTNVNGFEDLIVYDEVNPEEFAEVQPLSVAALIAAGDDNIAKIFDNLFDLDIADDDEDAFDSMLTAYDALLAQKKAADLLNKKIEKALEKGVDIDVLDDVEKFIGDPEAVLNPENDDDLYLAVAGEVGDWADNDYIDIADANFVSMIDWANIEALYANYKASTADIEKIAIKIALEYIAWAGDYDAEDGEITFSDKVFEDLEPLQIDIYSYDMIKEIVETYEALQGIDKANTPVNVPVNEDEVYAITLKTVTDYCYEMLTYFYDIVDALHYDYYATIKAAYPFFGATTKSAPWYTTTESLNDTGLGIVADAIITKHGNSDLKTYIMNALRGATEFYAKGDAIGNYSLRNSIISVNPNSYATRNSSNAVTAFDATGYKAAVSAAIQSGYKSYVDAYIKSADYAAALDLAVTQIATGALNAGIWKFDGEIVINGDVYDYSVDTLGSAWQFVVTDADGDVVDKAVAGGAAEVEVKYNGDDYIVYLTPALKTADGQEGKFVITPSVVAVDDGEDVDVYDLLDDIDADDVDALTYDVRDYIYKMGANIFNITDIPLLGNKSKNLDTFTNDEIKAIFEAEAKNDFWVEFNSIKARMYASDTSLSAWKLGSYIVDTTNYLKDDVKAKIVNISKLAYEKANGMTADANTIEDVLKVFDIFRNDVKNVLKANGYEFKIDKEAKYEKITIKDPNALDYTIPYKANISTELTADGAVDTVFATANTYPFAPTGDNTVATTISYAWDGEFIYAYAVCVDETLTVGDLENFASSYWSQDDLEWWYRLGVEPTKYAEVKQFCVTRYSDTPAVCSDVKSVNYDDIVASCKVNGNTSYIMIKVPAISEEGVDLVAGDRFYATLQIDDFNGASSVYNGAAGVYAFPYLEFTLGDAE